MSAPSRSPGPALTMTTVWPRPDVCLVRLTGELDLDTAPRLDEYLRDQTRGRPSYLVLDLSGVELVAAAGLTVLMSAGRDDRGIHGQLRVVGASRHRAVDRVVRLTGVDGVLRMHTGVDDALVAIDRIKQN